MSTAIEKKCDWDDNGRFFYARVDIINLKWMWVYQVSIRPNRQFTLREYRSDDTCAVVRAGVEAHFDSVGDANL